MESGRRGTSRIGKDEARRKADRPGLVEAGRPGAVRRGGEQDAVGENDSVMRRSVTHGAGKVPVVEVVMVEEGSERGEREGQDPQRDEVARKTATMRSAPHGRRLEAACRAVKNAAAQP